MNHRTPCGWKHFRRVRIGVKTLGAAYSLIHSRLTATTTNSGNIFQVRKFLSLLEYRNTGATVVPESCVMYRKVKVRALRLSLTKYAAPSVLTPIRTRLKWFDAFLLA